MFPRRSTLSRAALLITFASAFVYIWVNTPDGTDASLSRNIDHEKALYKRSDVSKAYEAENPKFSHHHSNLSLEEFRDNMTLGGVNMSGLIELINNANDSAKSVELHSLDDHINVVNPHPFSYLLNAEHMCEDAPDLFLIIYIHTAPSHYKRRMVIRQTWGNRKYYSDVSIRLIFVMGQGFNESSSGSQDGLEFESEQYRDIVQESFRDSYRNLTYKGVAALKWVSTYCSHAKYVLKTDDDIFVNMFTLLRHLKSVDDLGAQSRGLIMCLVWHRMKVMRSGKWRVDENEWKDAYYPVYCSGSAFIMSTDVAVRLHEVSYHVPFFWVDDFYVTGLLPLKAANITHKQFMSTYVLDGRKLEEKFTGPQWFTYIFSHVHNLNMIQSVWKQLVQLSAGKDTPQVQFALPGHLPNEAEVKKKEEEEALKKETEKKKQAERKAKAAAKAKP